MQRRHPAVAIKFRDVTRRVSRKQVVRAQKIFPHRAEHIVLEGRQRSEVIRGQRTDRVVVHRDLLATIVTGFRISWVYGRWRRGDMLATPSLESAWIGTV